MSLLALFFFLHILKIEAVHEQTKCDERFGFFEGRCFLFVYGMQFNTAHRFCIEKGGYLSTLIFHESELLKRKSRFSFFPMWYPAVKSTNAFQSNKEITMLDGTTTVPSWFEGRPRNTLRANCIVTVPYFRKVWNVRCDKPTYSICEAHPGILIFKDFFLNRIRTSFGVSTGKWNV